MTRLINSPLLVIFGGEDEQGTMLSDMHIYHVDRAEWTLVKYAPGPSPPPRLLHATAAISSTMLVIIGGTQLPSDKDVPSPSSDTWLFDTRNSTWKRIADKQAVLPPCSCHSAIFASGIGQFPAVYVFGGFLRGSNANKSVYRLRIGDWRWEKLSIVVNAPDGSEVPYSPSTTDTAHIAQVPAERESQGAVWLPGKNGMLIIGGDAGLHMLNDAWLLVPAVKTRGAWRWRNLKFTNVRGRPENVIPNIAGPVLATLPTEKTQVVLWGGLGRCGVDVVPGDYAFLLDVDSLFTTRIETVSSTKVKGRLLHGMVRVYDKLVVFGGCDKDGIVFDAGLEMCKLPRRYFSSGTHAADFGPVAADLAAGRAQSPVQAVDVEEEEQVEAVDEQQMEQGNNLALMGKSSIAKGTPLTGRIIEVTPLGYFVSVVINDTTYKGVLVANPLKQSNSCTSGERETNNIGKVKEEPSTNKSAQEGGVEDGATEAESPQPKRLKLDPAAEMLPDEPDDCQDDDVIDVG